MAEQTTHRTWRVIGGKPVAANRCMYYSGMVGYSSRSPVRLCRLGIHPELLSLTLQTL